MPKMILVFHASLAPRDYGRTSPGSPRVNLHFVALVGALVASRHATVHGRGRTWVMGGGGTGRGRGGHRTSDLGVHGVRADPTRQTRVPALPGGGSVALVVGAGPQSPSGGDAPRMFGHTPLEKPTPACRRNTSR